PGFDPIAQSWSATGLSVDHDLALFAGCPATVFYRVHAISPKRGAGTWSNTVWRDMPPSAFERCEDEQLSAPANLKVVEAHGRWVVTWDQAVGDQIEYTLERALDPEFISAVVAYRGGGTKHEVLRGAESILYFRVSAVSDGRQGPWSTT